MTNLNQNLYSRFGLQLNQEEIQDGFQKHFKNVLLDVLDPLVRPNSYSKNNKLSKVQREVLKEACRQLFLDYDNYNDWNYGCRWFLEKEFYDEFEGDFNKYLFRLQVLMDIIYRHKLVRYELKQLAIRISKYLNDFPLLGVTVKIYKTKAPQLLPTTSKKFEEDIKNTLGLLETDKKYEHTLSNFENGLKEFLTAKTQANYKDVIEDMYTACDELIKAISGNKQRGFKHVQDKEESKKLGINGHQKELYKNLRQWMDEIKHGTIKDFDRNDTEMIISLSAAFIRYVMSKRI
jgi:hypothetical protein